MERIKITVPMNEAIEAQIRIMTIFHQGIIQIQATLAEHDELGTDPVAILDDVKDGLEVLLRHCNPDVLRSQLREQLGETLIDLCGLAETD